MALDPYTKTLPSEFQFNWIANCSCDLDAGLGIVFGGMYNPPYQQGTSPPLVTFTGVPASLVKSIRVNCDGAGNLGVATFKWYVNEVLQASGVLTAAAVALGTTGVTANFPVGAYSADNLWTSVPSVASWTSIDGSARVFSQATQAKQPQWIAAGGSPATGWQAGPNNQASVRGDGIASDLVSAFAPAQPVSLFSVLVPRSGSVNAVPIGDSAGGGGIYLPFNPAPPAATTFGIANGVSGDYAQILLGATVFPTAAMLLGLILNGANSQFPLHTISPLGAGNWTGMHLFSLQGTADFFGGDIPKLVTYSRAILPYESDAVVRSLCNLYGIP